MVTGHTYGVGGAIYKWAEAKGWEARGFSRTTGHDLMDANAREQVIAAALDADIFVNCAHAEFGQVDLAYKWFVQNHWNPDKVMFTIGSRSSDGIRYDYHPYSIQKVALDAAVKQLQTCPHVCRMIHLRFGYIDVPHLEKLKVNKLPLQAVTDVLEYALNSPYYIREMLVANHDGKPETL